MTGNERSSELSEFGVRLRDGDPDRFESALFAEPDVRERLFTLYAFNLELANAAWRATLRVSEPQIGAMRLRFWLDVIAEAYDGAPPRAHEIAEPLNVLIHETRPDRAPLERLVEARLRDLDPSPMQDFTALYDYVDETAGSLMRVAVQIATPPERRSHELDRVAADLGAAQGVARLFEATPALGAQSRLLLPAPAVDRSAAMKGETTDGLRAVLRAAAEEGLRRLRRARARRREIPRAAASALLAAWRSERVLRTALRPDVDAFRDFGPESDFRRRASLLWRGLTGMW